MKLKFLELCNTLSHNIFEINLGSGPIFCKYPANLFTLFRSFQRHVKYNDCDSPALLRIENNWSFIQENQKLISDARFEIMQTIFVCEKKKICLVMFTFFRYCTK